jgi:hypothetical protein
MADSGMMPALFTMTSTRPHSASAASTRARTSVRSVTSTRRLRAVPPAASIPAAMASSRSVRRAPSMTLAPWAARSRAIASPMPLDAPVTTTTLSIVIVQFLRTVVVGET